MTGTAGPPEATAERVLGVGLMTGAMLIAPGLDVIAKLLLDRLTPAQVAAGRFLMQTLVLAPILLQAGAARRPAAGHAVAGLCLGGALVCLNHALTVMPVANAIAIFFVEPLILTLLAALVLGERIGWRRVAAIAVGLLGALVVLRPNVAAYGPAALFPLGTAILFAFYMLVTRAMSRTRRGGAALQFWSGAFAALGLVVFATAEGALSEAPRIGVFALDGREWALFALLGLLAALTHRLIVLALTRIEAGIAAPFQYLEIVSATLLGWLVFGDFPDALTWAGTAIIVGAGLYVFHRTRRAG
jgi:drug/metabolite transporter (DMT)-like permease